MVRMHKSELLSLIVLSRKDTKHSCFNSQQFIRQINQNVVHEKTPILYTPLLKITLPTSKIKAATKLIGFLPNNQQIINKSKIKHDTPL